MTSSSSQLPPADLAAVVLAAGFGTRLRPITHSIAKPLLPVGDSPLLGQTLIKLHLAGFRKLGVNASYRLNDVKNYVSTLPFKVHLSPENTILGTAGGILRLSQRLNASRLLSVNGDIFGDIDLKPLWKESHPSLTMGLKRLPFGSGTVGVGSEGQVVRLRGEVFGTEVCSGDYLGVCVLGQTALTSLPAEGCLIGDWALPQLRKGQRIETSFLDSSFIDIGTPGQLLAANLEFLRARSLGSWVDNLATVACTAEVRTSIICQRAKVLGSGVIEDCLILPGAQVKAPLRRAVVAPTGEVLPCL